MRFDADVVARSLADAVFAAGGEPFVMHPYAPGAAVDEAAVRERLWLADAVLLPGGGDLASRWYGQEPHPALYDVDEEQDAFDLAVARVTLADSVPLLAICRGAQLVNVALGGDLVQDMADRGDMAVPADPADPADRGDTAETVDTADRLAAAGDHRGRMHRIEVVPGSLIAGIAGTGPSVSCHHHQCIDRLGAGLVAVARSEDGVVEAVTLQKHPGWFLGVQWHPEDSAATDPFQAGLFAAFVDAARHRARAGGEALGRE